MGSEAAPIRTSRSEEPFRKLTTTAIPTAKTTPYFRADLLIRWHSAMTLQPAAQTSAPTGNQDATETPRKLAFSATDAMYGAAEHHAHTAAPTTPATAPPPPLVQISVLIASQGAMETLLKIASCITDATYGAGYRAAQTDAQTARATPPQHAQTNALQDKQGATATPEKHAFLATDATYGAQEPHAHTAAPTTPATPHPHQHNPTQTNAPTGNQDATATTMNSALMSTATPRGFWIRSAPMAAAAWAIAGIAPPLPSSASQQAQE